MRFAARVGRLKRSIAVRLSLWFAVLFAAGFSLLFGLMYVVLGQQLETREYEALQLRLQQYANIYSVQGLAGLRERVAEDSAGPHVRSLFIRLVGPRGESVWGKVPPDWIEQDTRRVPVPDGWGGWTEQRVQTVRVPRDEEQDLMSLSRTLPDGLLLQVARSTDNRKVLLAPLRRTFVSIGGGVVLCAFGVGCFAAWRATRPLQGVVEAARRIVATGDKDIRVKQPRRDDDVGELVRAFNTLLDRNDTLLRAMREALDNVAHDLRTPLTALRGMAEVALASGDAHAAREALADCVERSDDVLRLLRALTELSEAEAGMLRLDRAPIDLAELARAAAGLYTEIAEAGDQSLLLSTPAPVIVQADTTRLRQAVANLIDNALKYTPEGGRITVSVATEGADAVLRVADTGPGVPEGEQGRIWERLYRCDQSRSKSGLGLGLSLVRAIVEAHGGTTSVANAAEGGAVFTLRLPVAPTLAVV